MSLPHWGKKQFVIFEDESIDSAFARFNTIITSLKALDEGYSRKNYVRKFLRALHPKWRAKVTTIEESEDLTSLSLDELIGNLKVHEKIIKKDSEIVKAKIRETTSERQKDEKSRDDKNGKSDRKCFRCGDPNHLIGECPKPPKDKNQRAFVEGSWSDSGEEDDEKVNNETCLVAQASSEKKASSDVGQICDNKCRVTFSEHDSEITKDGKVIEQVKTMKIQAGVQVSRQGELRRHLQLWKKIEESLNVTFDETPPPSKTSPLVDDDLNEEEEIKVTKKKNLENDIEDETLKIDEMVNIKESRNHPLENIVAMQEELNQFIANDVWELVPQPRNMTIIGTKWVFRNKLDENGIVSRNKARLVAQGYNQQEGIDYDETYAPVARLESIRILLAYACTLDFKLFQMDVKSAFLNGFINEEVYVAQPLGFIDFEKPDHVYKLKKALYGLKQAPKAWYDRLKAFLIKHEYKIGMVDNTLFTKKKSSNLIIVQIYVDDIIFGSTYQDMCDEFAKIMHDEFEMSMMGELNFFLGLQIKQMEDGIFFNQSKYIKEMLKKFGLEESKPMKTPMSSDTKLTKDEECESVDSTKYRGMIGSLLYLTASRPDIMFSVCLCARFQEAPKTSHLEAVKRIF
ncbi:retrovirus-related pol polyprotein from transposon TNT 1-94 [Tanacetum coccineum]